jgi:Macrocin-O-methyltransferase (TylF)
MKKLLKKLITRCIPTSLKKHLHSIWQEFDVDFYLFSKQIKIAELFQKRFIWNDLNMPIKAIESRFGESQIIYLITDRGDYPKNKNIKRIDEKDIGLLDQKKICPIICAFESDEKLIRTLSIIKDRPNIYYYSPFRYIPASRYFHKNDIAKNVLINDYHLHRGKFDLPDFENIIQCIDITKDIQGDFVEIGVYKGDSAHVALNYMRKANIKRKSYFLDLFDGFINEPSKRSKDAIWLNSHADTSLPSVQEYLSDFDNCLIQKLDIIDQELPPQIKKIALCNIDVDIHEAIEKALIKVSPLIESGGIIILEDQGHTPFLAGALLATVEFLSTDIAKNFIPIHLTSGQLLLIRK